MALFTVGEVVTAAKMNALTPIPATSLPGSPIDGQFAILTDSLTAGTYQWMFRWNDGSSNTDKWEFVGGAALRAPVIDTNQNTTSTSYVGLTTAGPTLTLPVAGQYTIDFGCGVAQGVTNNASYMSFDIGATGAVDGNAIQHTVANHIGHNHHNMRSVQITAAAADVLLAKYKTNASGSADFAFRWMNATPIRVS